MLFISGYMKRLIKTSARSWWNVTFWTRWIKLILEALALVSRQSFVLATSLVLNSAFSHIGTGVYIRTMDLPDVCCISWLIFVLLWSTLRLSQARTSLEEPVLQPKLFRGLINSSHVISYQKRRKSLRSVLSLMQIWCGAFNHCFTSLAVVLLFYQPIKSIVQVCLTYSELSLDLEKSIFLTTMFLLSKLFGEDADNGSECFTEQETDSMVEAAFRVVLVMTKT